MLNILQVLNKTGFLVRRKSPELLVAAAIIAAAGSIILSVRATPKADLVLAKANNDIATIKSLMNDDNKIANKEYSVSLGRKELLRVYAKTAYSLGKLYLPTAICFGITVGGVLGSHNILRGRNMALAAAYTVSENGYKAYRDRVAGRIGSELEQDIFRGISSKDITVIEKDEDGNDVVNVTTVKGPHINVDSDFSVIFDRNAKDWYRDTHLVLNNLAIKEKYLNDRLVAYGALFLHEVYAELGIDIYTLGDRKNQASRVLGWIYDPSDNTRNSYISFGLFDRFGNRNEYAMSALRGNAQELYLEFNVDGDILTGDGGGKTFTKYRKAI